MKNFVEKHLVEISVSLKSKEKRNVNLSIDIGNLTASEKIVDENEVKSPLSPRLVSEMALPFVKHVSLIGLMEVTLEAILLGLCVYYLLIDGFSVGNLNLNPFHFKKNDALWSHVSEALQDAPKYIFASQTVLSTAFLIILFYFVDLKSWIAKIITFVESFHVETVKSRIVIPNVINGPKNEIISTVTSGSRVKILALSFIYGVFAYLLQPIQIWCIVISACQFYLLNSTKSVVPLVAFTIFTSILFVISENSKIAKDEQVNKRIVNLEKETIKRGDIEPGMIVKLQNGDECPCDVVILKATSTTERKRLIFCMNQVQVTGENAPVRKFAFDGKDVEITIENINVGKIRVNNQDMSDSYIGYANSYLICAPDISVYGVAAWVGTETRALKKSETKELAQTTPYSDYTTKGFIMTLIGLLGFSLLTASISYRSNHDLPGRPHFLTIWMNYLLYMNMIIPQALEQMKHLVCKFLSFSYAKPDSEVFCNSNLSIDILGHVNRIVTDKTGSLTQNKMESINAVIFDDETDMIVKSMKKEDISKESVLVNIYSVFACTGFEPEEIGIREILADFAQLVKYEPPEQNESASGEIVLKTCDDQVHTLEIICNFGFQRPLLSKSCLATVNGKFYLFVQAGDVSFWESKVSSALSSKSRLARWDGVVTHFDAPLGAPRIWSNGYKVISKEEAQNIQREWRSIIERGAEQSEFVRSILQNVLISQQTLMIDKYRPGVIEGIQKLERSQKQVFICTGDSAKNAREIATQFGYPKRFFTLDLTSDQNPLRKSLDDCILQTKSSAITIFVNQPVMLYLQKLETDFGWTHPTFRDIFQLMRRRPNDTYNYFVFCQATPSLKPWVCKLAQANPIFEWKDHFKSRNYVMAVGDGANDLNLIAQADVSLGIKSGETKDVIEKSSFWSTEWSVVTTLLLKDGPKKSSLISLLVRFIFLKHWITAFILMTDLFYLDFPIAPIEPLDQILNNVYNFVIFTQISSHTSRDERFPKNDISISQRVNSFESLFRFVLGAAMNGIAICVAVRFLYPSLPRKEFGSLLHFAQSLCITFYLIIMTKEWSDTRSTDTRDSSYLERVQIFAFFFYVGLVPFLRRFLSAVYLSIPLLMGLVLILRVWLPPLIKSKNYENNSKLHDIITWTHSLRGRIILFVFFIFIIKLLTPSIPILSFLTLGITLLIFTFVIFGLFIWKNGILKAILSGQTIAIAIMCLLIGIILGKLQVF